MSDPNQNNQKNQKNNKGGAPAPVIPEIIVKNTLPSTNKATLEAYDRLIDEVRDSTDTKSENKSGKEDTKQLDLRLQHEREMERMKQEYQKDPNAEAKLLELKYSHEKAMKELEFRQSGIVQELDEILTDNEQLELDIKALEHDKEVLKAENKVLKRKALGFNILTYVAPVSAILSFIVGALI